VTVADGLEKVRRGPEEERHEGEEEKDSDREGSVSVS